MNSTTTPSSAQTHAGGFVRIDADTAADLIHRRGNTTLPALAVFDVRDRTTFERRHIAGAEHLTEALLGGTIRRLPKSTPVLIYCYHGNASQVYAEMFADFRFAEVYSVDGGFEPLNAALAQRTGGLASVALPPQASEALKAFVAEFDFDPTDLDAARAQGLTPLMRAAYAGSAGLVEELLAAGVNPARRNGDGNNALWLACVSRDKATLARLIAAGIDVDNVNDTGATCLMYAASSGRAEVVEVLLAAGADPYIRNFDDARAVDLASTVGCLKLLRHTAN
ncbi:ankyrin repeat domain-containing protein [Zoogloea sp. LCSB751]|uniref:ankyrin repeat domain-containing protein n=1 Tax=Zoogloea sp. LCSB751 TaxID=1965277 RepID=UPI0009A4ED3E|nr:ankyrin repeat domain-containing protein [Zoogloea sp. LCSB751]